MKKLIRYRLPVSVTFTAGHPRKGEPTWFINKIEMVLGKFESCTIMDFERDEKIIVWPKLHTCRGNYKLWEKRFEKIKSGEAVLELYYWTGKAYRSKPIVICQLGKDDGIGLQKLDWQEMIQVESCRALVQNDKVYTPLIKETSAAPTIETLAANDGLSIPDFKAWFKGYDLSEPMAIIHFTKFRY